MAAIGPFCRTSRTVRTRSAASLFERMPEWNLALRARTSANSVEPLRGSRRHDYAQTCRPKKPIQICQKKRLIRFSRQPQSPCEIPKV
jgi:hypothetical protein